MQGSEQDRATGTAGVAILCSQGHEPGLLCSTPAGPCSLGSCGRREEVDAPFLCPWAGRGELRFPPGAVLGCLGTAEAGALRPLRCGLSCAFLSSTPAVAAPGAAAAPAPARCRALGVTWGKNLKAEVGTGARGVPPPQALLAIAPLCDQDSKGTG